MDALFLREFRSLQSAADGLYDLINPTAAAMWNLRSQVQGYVAERDDLSNEELHGRFVAGSGIGSANLRRHCVETSWEDQRSELAVLALYAGISLYEGWTGSLEVGTEKQRARLQFPSQGNGTHTKPGAGETVTALRATPSPTMEDVYGQELRTTRRYLPGRLDDLLLAYRCYKEARNACAHAGRVASDWAEQSFLEAHPRQLWTRHAWRSPVDAESDLWTTCSTKSH